MILSREIKKQNLEIKNYNNEIREIKFTANEIKTQTEVFQFNRVAGESSSSCTVEVQIFIFIAP